MARHTFISRGEFLTQRRGLEATEQSYDVARANNLHYYIYDGAGSRDLWRVEDQATSGRFYVASSLVRNAFLVAVMRRPFMMSYKDKRTSGMVRKRITEVCGFYF